MKELFFKLKNGKSVVVQHPSVQWDSSGNSHVQFTLLDHADLSLVTDSEAIQEVTDKYSAIIFCSYLEHLSDNQYNFPC